MDGFYTSSNLPAEFRNAYALMKRGETLSDALTKAGDSLTKQRTAINSFLVKQKGLTDIEQEALSAAGKASTSEGVVRALGVILKPVGYLSSIVHLPAGVVTAAGGEGLKAVANKMASGRIEKAVATVKSRSLSEIAK
jgi:hypothetical protein